MFQLINDILGPTEIPKTLTTIPQTGLKVVE